MPGTTYVSAKSGIASHRRSICQKMYGPVLSRANLPACSQASSAKPPLEPAYFLARGLCHRA